MNKKCCIECRIAPTNEIVQLSILPYNFSGVIFDTYIKPRDITLIEGSGVLGGAKFYGIKDIIEKGVKYEEALDLLDRWYKTLKLKKGERIIPIGYDWLIKNYHLIEFFSFEMYYMFFSSEYRDLKSIIGYIQDRSIMTDPFPKDILNITGLCTKLGIKHERSHDSLYLCSLISQCYKRLLKGNFE